VAEPSIAHSVFQAIGGSEGILQESCWTNFTTSLEATVHELENSTIAKRRKSLKIPDGETILALCGKRMNPVLMPRSAKGPTTHAPGRLVLTDQKLYFDASFAVLRGKDVVVLDLTLPDIDVHLAADGPFGTKVFDRGFGVSLKGQEPTVFAFPQLTTRTREVWFAMCREVVAAHQFIATHGLESSPHAVEKILSIVKGGAVRAQALCDAALSPEMFSRLCVFSSLPQGTQGQRVAAALVQWATSAPEKRKSGFRISIRSEETDEGEKSGLRQAAEDAYQVAQQVQSASDAVEASSLENVRPNVLLFVLLMQPLALVIQLTKDTVTWKHPLKSVAVAWLILFMAWKQRLHLLPAIVVFSQVLIMVYLRMHPPKALVLEIDKEKKVTEKLKLAMDLVQSLQKRLITVNGHLLKLRGLYTSQSPLLTNEAICVLSALSVVLTLLSFFPLECANAPPPTPPHCPRASPPVSQVACDDLHCGHLQRTPPPRARPHPTDQSQGRRRVAQDATGHRRQHHGTATS